LLTLGTCGWHGCPLFKWGSRGWGSNCGGVVCLRYLDAVGLTSRVSRQGERCPFWKLAVGDRLQLRQRRKRIYSTSGVAQHNMPFLSLSRFVGSLPALCSDSIDAAAATALSSFLFASPPLTRRVPAVSRRHGCHLLMAAADVQGLPAPYRVGGMLRLGSFRGAQRGEGSCKT